MPSMVVMLLPAAWMAGTRQEVTSRPSMMTEQAPHSPSPQPSLVPVRRRSFRMMSISRVIGSTSAERSSPFTVSSMCIVSSLPLSADIGSDGTSPSWNLPQLEPQWATASIL